MKNINNSNLKLGAIDNDWQSYKQIAEKTKLSVGLISKIIWDNINNIQNHIQWKSVPFGEKIFQSKMMFRKK